MKRAALGMACIWGIGAVIADCMFVNGYTEFGIELSLPFLVATVLYSVMAVLWLYFWHKIVK